MNKAWSRGTFAGVVLTALACGGSEIAPVDPVDRPEPTPSSGREPTPSNGREPAPKVAPRKGVQPGAGPCGEAQEGATVCGGFRDDRWTEVVVCQGGAWKLDHRCASNEYCGLPEDGTGASCHR